VDQVGVEVAGVGDRIGDRLLGDLVEHHPLGRHLRLELLQQVPGNRLPLAVTIGGQQQLVDVGELLLQRLDGGPLVGLHHVQRRELVVDVHPGARPLLALVLGGHVGRTGGEVTDMATARLDDIPVAEVARDLVRLGRRLDDHETADGLGRSHEVPLCGSGCGDEAPPPGGPPAGHCMLALLSTRPVSCTAGAPSRAGRAVAGLRGLPPGLPPRLSETIAVTPTLWLSGSQFPRERNRRWVFLTRQRTWPSRVSTSMASKWARASTRRATSSTRRPVASTAIRSTRAARWPRTSSTR